MEERHKRYVKAKARLELELMLHKRHRRRGWAVVRSFLRLQSTVRVHSTLDQSSTTTTSAEEPGETRLRDLTNSRYKRHTSQAFRQELSDLLLKHQADRQMRHGRRSTGHSPSVRRRRRNRVASPEKNCLGIRNDDTRDLWSKRSGHGQEMENEEHLTQTNVPRMGTAHETEENGTISCQRYVDDAPNDVVSPQSTGSDQPGHLTFHNWQPKLELNPVQEDSEEKGYSSSQFGVIFSSESEDDGDEDFSSEGSATEILGDSEQLAKGVLTQTEYSKQGPLSAAFQCTKEQMSFQERRERFAMTHPLDFSVIKTELGSDRLTTEYRKRGGRHTSKLGEPTSSGFFIFQTKSGNNTPSVQQYVDRLEQIGKEITRMYGEEFERVLSKLSIVDLSYTAFRGVAQGLVGAGSMTKDKIWKLIGFGRTAVESVPEDQTALKQNFEQYTAAVVEEVAEEWIEKNGGWGAMLEETVEAGDEEQSQPDSHLKATDWEEFLEHVGKVLQGQDGVSVNASVNAGSRKRKRQISSEDMDELMQHVEKALHGADSDAALDDFMAHVNSTLHGHMAGNSGIDRMLHQVRRNLMRHQRSSRLSSASSDLFKLDVLSPVKETTDSVEVAEVDGESKPDQVSVDPLPTTLQDEEKQDSIDRLDNKFPVSALPFKDGPQRTASDRHPTLIHDASNHSDSNENPGMNTDQTGIWFQITQLSLAFALGVAIGMIVMKYVI